MRPKGDAAVLEARRRQGVALLEQGFGVREVARQLGVEPSSVSRWKEAVKKGGPEALVARPNPGRPPRLSDRQKEKLLKLLLKGATAHGYCNDLWTLPRVAELIEKQFGVHYHPAHVWKILRQCQWSCQKPERQAREMDEAQVERWRSQRWPAIKKSPSGGAKHRVRG